VAEVDLLGRSGVIDIRGDDGIELAGLQRRDDAVPILGDEGALELHLVAKRLGDVDVEADELAIEVRLLNGG